MKILVIEDQLWNIATANLQLAESHDLRIVQNMGQVRNFFGDLWGNGLDIDRSAAKDSVVWKEGAWVPELVLMDLYLPVGQIEVSEYGYEYALQAGAKAQFAYGMFLYGVTTYLKIPTVIVTDLNGHNDVFACLLETAQQDGLPNMFNAVTRQDGFIPHYRWDRDEERLVHNPEFNDHSVPKKERFGTRIKNWNRALRVDSWICPECGMEIS